MYARFSSHDRVSLTNKVSKLFPLFFVVNILPWRSHLIVFMSVVSDNENILHRNVNRFTLKAKSVGESKFSGLLLSNHN